MLATNSAGQNIPIQDQQNLTETRVPEGTTNNDQIVSNTACRFATSRSSFAPFTVIFSPEVSEKIVVEDLIRYAADNWNFELKTVAYRRGRSENYVHRILIFVANSKSFVFLLDQRNRPNTLADPPIHTKTPIDFSTASFSYSVRFTADRLG